MNNAKVSTCANTECNAEFKRLGDGKLFVRPIPGGAGKHSGQKALWLCSKCAEHFDLRFDKKKQQFTLVHRRKAA